MYVGRKVERALEVRPRKIRRLLLLCSVIQVAFASPLGISPWFHSIGLFCLGMQE